MPEIDDIKKKLKTEADERNAQILAISLEKKKRYGNKNWKYLYKMATTDAERIDIIAQFNKLK